MRAGWDNWGSASLVYYWKKWGTTGDTGDNCSELEVPAPGGGIMLRSTRPGTNQEGALAQARGAPLAGDPLIPGACGAVSMLWQLLCGAQCDVRALGKMRGLSCVLKLPVTFGTLLILEKCRRNGCTGWDLCYCTQISCHVLSLL